MNRSQASAAAASEPANPQATRETVESIVVAVILAFLFRAFVAEAFVIPTGSMAPTLQGRHLDVICNECGYQYRTGASMENEGQGRVTRTTCPICRYPKNLERTSPTTFWLFRNNEDSFNGDRILVSKFAYQMSDPERWDVIVFKYPGNAKQNYIKRLIGLPNETIMIRHGDIYISPRSERDKPETDRRWQIARKPPEKVKAMLQLVDDTRYIPQRLREIGWPSRWQSRPGSTNPWEVSEDGTRFTVTAGAESWLRYRHLTPRKSDWAYIEEGMVPDRLANYRGQLISDYYAYNDFSPHAERASRFGSCWVGDLGMAANLRIEDDQGEVMLDLVEGGVHYTCTIDVATGEARLDIDGGARAFIDEATGNQAQTPRAQTSIRGAGSHHIRYANVDDKLFLWIDEQIVEFDAPPVFISDNDVEPKWSPEDPGDLSPVGIGARNVSLTVNRLRVYRDVYYQAVEADDRYRKSEYESYFQPDIDDLERLFSTPEEWATTNLFRDRRMVSFDLDEDQFFPLGDNSPQSKDARLWSEAGTARTGYSSPPPHVDRDLLIGKALLIYWPHQWRPFLPNFARMGLIR